MLLNHDPDLAPEHRAVFESALAWAQATLPPYVKIMEEEDRWPEGLWELLGRQGYLGAGVPEEYGGSGGDFMTGAQIGRAISRVSGAISLSMGAHLNLCTHNILRNGTEEQKRKYLPRLCSGEWVGALCLTEPDHGSDAMGIETRAVRDGDHFVVNGSKMFITNGPDADVLILYAKTAPEKGAYGITAFIAETAAPGFTVAGKLEKLGMLGSPTGWLTFDNFPVPAENILGRENQGFIVVMSGLDIERAFLGCAGLGGIEASLEASMRYAAERKQFGQPIAEYELIQAKIADIYAGWLTAKLGIYHALEGFQAGRRVSLESAAAVLHASRVAKMAADHAMQIHGGYGYTKDFPVERFWRDSMLTGIGGGTNEIRQLLIARELLGDR